jgi:hypothetical protein
MEIYNYNPVTGEYLGPSQADESPLEPGVFLIPAYACTDAPPPSGQNEAAVRADGEHGAWQVVPDYRGTIYWLPDGSRYEITELGAEPPASALPEPPPPSLDQIRAVRRTLMKIACAEAIQVGIVCNALGADHTYPTSLTDQQNLTATVLAAQVNGVADEPYMFWCADSNGVWARRPHTAAQILAVGETVRAHVVAQQDRYEAKLAEIDAAAAPETINAISW